MLNISEDTKFNDRLWSEKEYNELLNDFSDKIVSFFQSGAKFTFNSTITPFLYEFMPEEEKKLLFYYHWITSVDIIVFLKKMKSYFRKLNINSVYVENTFNNKIIGNPLWNKTFQERIQRRTNQNIFVCQITDKNLISHEILLVKKILEMIHSVSSKLMLINSITKDKLFLQQITKLQKISFSYLKLNILKEIPFIPTIELLNKSKIEFHNKSKFYILCLNIIHDYFIQSRSYKETIKLEKLFHPESYDKLFELLVLYQIIDEYIRNGFTPIKNQYSVIVSRSQKVNSKILTLSTSDEKVDFFYQDSSLVKDDYKKLLKIFKLGSTNILDIVLRISKSDENNQSNPKYILVEVKRSNRQPTLKDGLAQLMHYLTITKTNEVNNIGILVGWDFPETPEKEKQMYNGVLYKYLTFKSIINKRELKFVYNDEMNAIIDSSFF